MRPETPSDPDQRTIAIGPSSMAYTETGSGRAVVAIHGLPASSRDFRWLDAAFDGRVRFLRLDLPGFGASPIADRKVATFTSMAQAVKAYCRAMDLRGVVLLGHSAGGPIALEAALDNDRVAGVVLVNSSGKVMHKGNFPRTYRAMLAVADLSRFTRAAVLGMFKPIARRLGFSKRITDDQLTLAARLNGFYDPKRFGEHIAQLDKPVLVAWATADPAVQANIPRGILADARHPTGLALDAKSHNLQSSHATEVADAVASWSAETLPRL